MRLDTAMSVKLFLVRGRLLMAVACAIFFLGLGQIALAQSDVTDRAPWQAPPDNYVPAGLPPSGSCDDCSDEDGPSCGDCGGCDECAFQQPWLCGLGWLFNNDRVWLRTEYLMWWTKSAFVPPLVTTSPAGTAYENAGVLGEQGTSVLFGGDVSTGLRSGARIALGTWLTDCHDVGLEASYMFLGNQAASYSASSDGNPILARPFYDVGATPGQNATVLAYPNTPNEQRVQTGSIDVRDGNELTSADVLFRSVVFEDCGRQLDFLIGYRYARFSENLTVNSSTTFVSGFQTPDGTNVHVTDVFDAHNEFNGAEIGIVAKRRFCRFSTESVLKLAVGSMRSRVNVTGATLVNTPGASSVIYDGGVLALPTNSGGYVLSDFAVIPELGLTLGYDITCRLRATAGFTLLYISRVARPGELVDTNINSSQLPPGRLVGTPSPAMDFTTTDFWAQGLNFGLDYRF